LKIPGTDVEYNPTLESTTQRADELKPEVVYGLKRAAKHLAFLAARRAYPTQKLVVRDMTAQDLEVANIEWAGTGVADAWGDHDQVAAATIDDGKFVAIYGCRMMEVHLADTLPVTAFKFIVGGSEVARWDLYKMYAATGDGVTLTAIVQALMPVGVITESPIVISENMTITIEQWGGNATAYTLALEGVVVELERKTLKP